MRARVHSGFGGRGFVAAKWPLCCLALFVGIASLLPSQAARAFTVDNGSLLCAPGGVSCPSGPGVGQSLDVLSTLEQAARWSATPVLGVGLQDGIQVSVEAGFGEAISPGQGATVEQGLLDAFAAWESPVLSFDITLDGPGGFELDVFAVPESDPVFTGNDFFGVAFFATDFSATRTLTNGDTLAGWAITGAEIYFNIDLLQAVQAQICLLDANPACSAPELSLALAGFVNLAMHEVGHAIGLDHPNEFPFANFDTDGDPTNAIVVDPDDPFADLAVSGNFDPNAVMVSPKPLSDPSRFDTVLAADDIAGRDVLYPLPEPALGTLAVATAAIAVLRGRRRTHRDA